jgi:hypothetical protein
MFAQIGANRFVQRRNPSFRRNYFQAVAGIHPAARPLRERSQDVSRDSHRRGSGRKKTLEKSSFVQRRFVRARIAGSRR